MSSHKSKAPRLTFSTQVDDPENARNQHGVFLGHAIVIGWRERRSIEAHVEHEVPVAATSSLPLTKSLAGLRRVLDPVPEGVALLMTNEYETLKWPGTNDPMSLKGSAQDRKHVRKFLQSFGFVPGVTVEPIDNALRKDIENRIGKAVDSCPSLLVAYFQGHGENRPNVRYITGDYKTNGTLEVITGEELIKMFSRLTIRTLALVITDFCYSGNTFRLQFQLCITSDGNGFWSETDEWREDIKVGRKHRVVSPMLHVAASNSSEPVYETKKRGGYFTNGLAHLDPEPTLTQFLFDLRQRVNGHLADAKTHPTNPLSDNDTQTAQIFCSGTPPLDDPEIFSQIRLGIMPASD